MNYCSVATCIRCYQVTNDGDNRTLCQSAAGNVNELLLCGYVYVVTKLLMMVNLTIVPCYMSICDIAAGNVNELLLCGQDVYVVTKLLMMVTIVPCYMSICDIAAGNVNELLLCGKMYTLLPSY